MSDKGHDVRDTKMQRVKIKTWQVANQLAKKNKSNVCKIITDAIMVMKKGIK